MFAAMTMRAAQGQKEPPDEGTTMDVETVAHLLPCCDAMFMDNRCRPLLLDVPKDLRPPETARVFSLTSKIDLLVPPCLAFADLSIECDCHIASSAKSRAGSKMIGRPLVL